MTLLEITNPKVTYKIYPNRGVDGGFSTGPKIICYLDGKKIGEAGAKEYSRNGAKIWSITTVRVNNSLVGKGYGKFVYNSLILAAKESNVQSLISTDTKRSKGAEHSWEQLAKTHKAENTNGKWVLNTK